MLCNVDRRSDFVCRCKIWKRKLLKFHHYFITNLTEQNIQSSFHSILEICRMCRPRVFITLTYTVVHEMQEQNMMITQGKLKTIVITIDLKLRTFLFNTMLNYCGIRKRIRLALSFSRLNHRRLLHTVCN